MKKDNCSIGPGSSGISQGPGWGDPTSFIDSGLPRDDSTGIDPDWSISTSI